MALIITALQVLGALHFALVPHGFSAALGGVVHVHGESAHAEPQPFAHEARSVALVASGVACVADLCPFADAPPSSVARIALLLAGSASFGQAQLLSESQASSPSKRRVFLSAPKTSPPV